MATSSTRDRRWRSVDGAELHHVLDPFTRSPACSELVTVTVRAADATTADVLATALLVRPAAVLGRLSAFRASALVEDQNGNRWTTSSWKEAA